jgi:universal stress protein A
MSNVKKILVPVDFSECSVAAAKQALAISGPLGAKLDVIHTYDLPSFIAPSMVMYPSQFEAPLAGHAEKQASEQLANFCRRVGLFDNPDVTVRVMLGPAGPTILDVAASEHPDLIVIGTHGRTGVARLLMGSTAETVLRQAPCPVLAVKAPLDELAAASAP